MDGLLLLEAQRRLLNQQISNLLNMISAGKLPIIMQATKQFISTLSEYLKLQELAVAPVLNSPQLVNQMRRENHYIRENLDDIYLVHITEPDGEFVEIITKIVRAVEEKLEQDKDLLSGIDLESYLENNMNNIFGNVA